MKNVLRTVGAFGIGLSLAACAAGTESRGPIDQAKQSLQQAQKDSDKAVEDAVKYADSVESTLLDMTSSGGAPGGLSLFGGLVGASGRPDARISLSSVAGFGWRGVRPRVDAKSVELYPEVSPSQAEEVEKLSSDEHFVNVGCEESAVRSSASHLKQLDLDSLKSNAPVLVLTANTVFICDPSRLAFRSLISVTAQTLVLRSLALSLNGSVGKGISIDAGELVLEGSNLIRSSAIDGASTLLSGPTISIAAGHVSGTGTLEVQAQGSNYQKARP